MHEGVVGLCTPTPVLIRRWHVDCGLACNALPLWPEQISQAISIIALPLGGIESVALWGVPGLPCHCFMFHRG